MRLTKRNKQKRGCSTVSQWIQKDKKKLLIFNIKLVKNCAITASQNLNIYLKKHNFQRIFYFNTFKNS